MAIEVITFGCRLNTAESEVMRQKAVEAGLSEAVLVNTCAVTGEAVRQAKQAIRRAPARQSRGNASSSLAARPRPRPNYSRAWPRST